jgi:hypothetical protein
LGRFIAIVAHPNKCVDGERSEDLGEPVLFVPEEACHLQHHGSMGEAPHPTGDDQFPVVTDPTRSDHAAHRVSQGIKRHGPVGTVCRGTRDGEVGPLQRSAR